MFGVGHEDKAADLMVTNLARIRVSPPCLRYWSGYRRDPELGWVGPLATIAMAERQRPVVSRRPDGDRPAHHPRRDVGSGEPRRTS